ncbi:modular protein with glycoside hydrolase family 13 and glycosyltransferase family 5 domains [Phaffia rhodozyma]|uniref:alpha-1,3-glucan synthase n=1 Tax=Phaffia rhodozyma TaxID=264483 RepID=A0A0F7SQK3_PHARH|nr:modular protein with glycoside hydrolase family 13 and glycosyltransferase family 5 domains [Phaffia rhodozyma]
MKFSTCSLFSLASLLLSSVTSAYPYTEEYVKWNININKAAGSDVLSYASERGAGRNTSYFHSPSNWRALPFYNILLDKFADGDPTNNDFFKSQYEHDLHEVNYRYGGDVKGLKKRLDYIQGAGYKAIYIAGTIFINMPWQADSYSPIDFSLIDPHWGVLDDWRDLVDEMHLRGMYLMLDFTVGTMNDYIGFDGYMNVSTPFSTNEYEMKWKHPVRTPWDIQQYVDFTYTNKYNDSCTLPEFFGDDGYPVDAQHQGCYASEFDQYGDMEAFGVHPDWQRQLSKFASVQDRLREWEPRVMDKITTFSCLAIKALDIDGIRIDKATQLTVSGLASWTSKTRACAVDLGKDNFFITGEVTGGNTFGALYQGRGRMPNQTSDSFDLGTTIKANDTAFFLRPEGDYGLDGTAFHYSVYRALTRFLGMDGNLAVAYDTDINFVSAYNTMVVTNDFLNPHTGEFDIRHMYGSGNFDVFRWGALESGQERSILGSFITTMLLPGVPLHYYGDEQGFYLFDNGASNYLFGRQPMAASAAWQRHGCYHLGADQYYNMPLEKALIGCEDSWNSLDHFDPTAQIRRILRQFNHLRTFYPAIQDGVSVVQLGNWTREEYFPGSNGTATEFGLWSVQRGNAAGVGDKFFDNATNPSQVWMLYTNENQTKTYKFPCTSDQWISTPFTGGQTLQNIIYPYDNVTLENSQKYYDGKHEPYTGCLAELSMDAYGFKIYVLQKEWTPPAPALTKFTPGHDARILATSREPSDVDITLEYNVPMNIDDVLKAISFTYGNNTNPNIKITNTKSEIIDGSRDGLLFAVDNSQWRFTATLTNVPNGIIDMQIGIVTASDATFGSTIAVDHLMIRKGLANNILVFPDQDYDNSIFYTTDTGYAVNHTAVGADLIRYTANYGANWTDWFVWEDTTVIEKSKFDGNSWAGQHIILEYFSETAAASPLQVHADIGYEHQRRVPAFLARGPYNNWGYDSGVTNKFTQSADDSQEWSIQISASWPTIIQLCVFGYDDYFYGDVDGDGVIDRLPPNSVAPNYLNMSAPPSPYVAWKIIVDDVTGAWRMEPQGNAAVSAVMFALLIVIPVLTAVLACLFFKYKFYGIHTNEWGVKAEKTSYVPIIGALMGKGKDQVNGEKKEFGAAGEVIPTKSGVVIGWPEDPAKPRRKMLIASLEYEILDWKLKVKIGGLGVMSTLMGKAMTDVDLIWVIPKVKDLEYPTGDYADPIEVTIFGELYLIEVESHVVDNIKYYILDSPVFRAQTKSDPYPARMDDLSSAIFYSAWNQAIAETIRRHPVIDIYHINDYHGALAPLYLLPKIIPVCLSLHNAEFQGLWPLRTKEEMKEVCAAFNISKEVCTKYVQFGNTFNLLHAGAAFISVHQNSVGVAGVSDKYGKRSWARYPALWTLRTIDSLPNPDPTDIAALDEEPIAVDKVVIDEVAEKLRPENKRLCQEWAGLKQDPKSDLFVFVGRWSKQKGVDLIADVMPSLLDKKPSIQLICVGPVIDLYGRFAAEKLARLMEMYPDRVFSKPEFTALPPYIFSGADFALIPSRDEPFGLVAVEFGRKGALGVGARLGGLGLMPGWWFPVESDTTKHMLSQLTKTIKLALKSTEEHRAILRARSGVQRFPVIEWRQRTEDFHKRSIRISRDMAKSMAWSAVDSENHGSTYNYAEMYPHAPELENAEHGLARYQNSGRRDSVTSIATSAGAYEDNGSIYAGYEDITPIEPASPHGEIQTYDDFLARANRQIAKDTKGSRDPFVEGGDRTPERPFTINSRVSSVDSISSIMDDKASSSPLNKAIVDFTDSNGEVAQDFVQKLQLLNAGNSKGDLCIEQFLIKSERKYFATVKKDKINASTASYKGSSIKGSSRDSMFGTPSPSLHYSYGEDGEHGELDRSPDMGLFGSEGHDSNSEPAHYPEKPMTRLQITMQRQIGKWPVYCVILAAGQMLSATSYQMTLLSGSNYQKDAALYTLSGIFLGFSFVWYGLFRMKPSVFVLSIPWIFFAISFFMIGIPALVDLSVDTNSWVSNGASWSYAIASAAGFLFFGCNFGEEAGAPTEVWAMRACIVQGLQQLWTTALWYWGNKLSGNAPGVQQPWWITLIVWPLAVLCLLFFVCLYWGLPDYYNQVPPKVPNFFRTLSRRKLVLWFLFSEILQSYWLSGPYGRNWTFLWSDTSVPAWGILIMVLVFFIGVWGLVLSILIKLSKTHSWILCVFAVGLGCPRWCQMLWGTSSLALYLPWGGSVGPYLGVGLWLWLGVLDAIQGIGLGMILLQTLSRLHVCATLALAQIIGSIAVMVARATSPNRIGPGSVFPDASFWSFEDGIKGSPMASGAFWAGLLCQILIVVGYFWFYRRETLSRP